MLERTRLFGFRASTVDRLAWVVITVVDRVGYSFRSEWLVIYCDSLHNDGRVITVLHHISQLLSMGGRRP